MAPRYACFYSVIQKQLSSISSYSANNFCSYFHSRQRKSLTFAPILLLLHENITGFILICSANCAEVCRQLCTLSFTSWRNHKLSLCQLPKSSGHHATRVQCTPLILNSVVSKLLSTYTRYASRPTFHHCFLPSICITAAMF